MRIKINFRLDNVLEIPIQYNHIVQAVILKWLGEDTYQRFLHDTGYTYENRKYKMYSFSKIMGKFTLNKERRTVTYYDYMSLIVTSSEEKFLTYIANNVILMDNVNFVGNEVEVESVEVLKNNIEGKNIIYTLSPITVYSTFNIDDRKKTYYYSPYERDFEELIRKNLLKKYTAFYGVEPTDKAFYIEPKDRIKESILNYKGIVIKAWNGEFLVKGSKDLIEMAYNSGLGSKNSQGFGCIEMKKNRA